MASLKAAFKVRCKAHDHPMSRVLAGLIEGWLRNDYQVILPSDPTPQNIYIPAEAWDKFRAACSPRWRNVPRRAVLEGLIAGWIDGRFEWPPRSDEDQ